MTFKVWDKVRCIRQLDYWTEEYFTIWNTYEVCRLNEWSIYNIQVTWDDWVKWNVLSKDFELVQEDKLPHELLWLDRYRVVKKDESDPLWGEFFNWFNSSFDFEFHNSWTFFWYDWNNNWKLKWAAAYSNIGSFNNNPTLITLAERDRCINKKPSQTKQLSKPIRSCEHNWSIYKEDTIDWVSIEDMKATRDNINSKLLTHRNLFIKFKKHD